MVTEKEKDLSDNDIQYAAKVETILEKAQRIVMGDREDMYGHPKDNHACTAELFNAYLKRRKQTMPYADALLSDELTATDICFLNILQKVSRCANKISKDSLADIAGWAYCVERILDGDNTADYDDGRHKFVATVPDGHVCERCAQHKTFHLHDTGNRA